MLSVANIHISQYKSACISFKPSKKSIIYNKTMPFVPNNIYIRENKEYG